MRQRSLAMLCVGMFVLTWLPLEARAAVPSGSHKVVVESKDTNALVQLARSGATLLADYGSFSVWRTNDTQRQTVAATSNVKTRDDFDRIHLRGGKTIVTTSGPTGGAPAVASNLQQAKTSGHQLWMVQFVGPIKPGWLDNLRKLGIEIVQYMPNNAYVVWLDGARLAQLENLAKNDPTVQWEGPYHPAYRLAPSLQTPKAQATALVPVTVQFYRTANTPASVASLRTLGGKVFRQPSNILKYTNISLEVPGNQLNAIAARADVFNVEPYAQPKRLDERQGQIVAGNVTGTNPVVPASPGYLAFLNGIGFPQDPGQYPVVDVVDDGIDNGTTSPLHPDFYQLGKQADGSRIVFNNSCTSDSTSNGVAGHGNINAGIVGAYNSSAESPYVDAGGYDIGLGISPYGRVAGTKIFLDDGNFSEDACGGTDAGTVLKTYQSGAAITSNSWGNLNSNGAYDSESQAYDALTRDATNSDTNTHQMLHIFAAGNDGAGGSQTVSTPSTGKNVLSVGATQNVRDDGVSDGCGVTDGSNADLIAYFSGRGPAADQRAKPDIVAPGTHVQGPASQDPHYNGTGVCGGNPDPPNIYYPTTTPTQQTLYTWSSGTSHSTPAIAGVASLVYNFYGRVIKPGQNPTAMPSPAMAKALMLNAPRYLTGTGGNLPDPNQGWGDANLSALFDLSVHRYVVDQTTTFTTTGETFTKSGTIPNTGKPFHVTLVWTDAPGSTTGNAIVNNLDLEVTVGGQVYHGNVFFGANSVPGGTADTLNNIENVFVPAGVSGPFTVKVTAANLADIGVPGAPGTTNQDFALVIYNGDITAAPALSLAGVTASDAAPGGNGNGNIEPGEMISLTVSLTNGGDAKATSVSGTLATTSAGITLGNPTSAYPDIAPNPAPPNPAMTTANSTPFTFTVTPAQACGSALAFTETVTYNGGLSTTFSFSLPTGASPIHVSTDVPKPIPDYDQNTSTPGVSDSVLPLSGPGTVVAITVKVNITHTWDGDLSLELISPTGTTVILSSRNGGSGQNYTNTVFDDTAPNPIVNGIPPYTGRFQPAQPLATVVGEPVSGTWHLHVTDNEFQDVGTINQWSLDIVPSAGLCTTFPPPTLTSISPSSGPNSGGTPVTIRGTNFTGQTSVTLDGLPATNVVVADSTTITAVTPAHPAAGPVTVQVTTNGTTLSLTNGYTYGGVTPAPGGRSGGGSGSPSPVPTGRSDSGAPAGTGNQIPVPAPPKR